MDDLQWSSRGQLCEFQAKSPRTDTMITYRIGVFETKEYAKRAAECVNACRGIDSDTLRNVGVMPRQLWFPTIDAKGEGVTT